MSARAMAESLAVSFLLTLLLEELFALAWGVRKKKELLLVGAVNLMTNPAVVLLHMLFADRLGAYRLVFVAALELCAIAAEAYCYKSFSAVRRPVLFAVSANAFSYFSGVALQLVL